MSKMSETAFSVGSSLEVLATVASMPNEGASYSSRFLALQSETPEIQLKASSAESPLPLPVLTPPQPSDEKAIAVVTLSPRSVKNNDQSKKRRLDRKSPLARRICLRLFSLRRRMNVCSTRVIVNPRSVTAAIRRVENDLIQVFGKRVFRPPKLPPPKTCRADVAQNEVKEEPVAISTEIAKFVEEGTQTAAVSPTTPLDIDILDPTVDFSVPCIQEHSFIPKISSNSLEASGQMLDSFLEKVELSEQGSVQPPSQPSAAVPEVFDSKPEHLTPTFVNMFWNTFPALKSDDGRVFVRLADISATALPAKDSSILKQRCNKLAIPVYSCTDLQRNFLVNYCFGSSCRSVFMVDCVAAKTLLGSYCQGKMKEHGLTLNDMQVVVLNEEDSQRLISSRLNLCSTKYVSNGTVVPGSLNNSSNDHNGLVLRRRIVSAPATPPSEPAHPKKTPRPRPSVSLAPCGEAHSAEPPASPAASTPKNEPSRQRLWSSAQIYNASVVLNMPEQIIITKKRKRKAKDCFDISKTPKRRRLPPRISKNTQPKDELQTQSRKRPPYLPMRFGAVLLPRSTPLTVRAVGQPATSAESPCKTGVLVPHLFVVPYAPCVKCSTCHNILSPLAFTRHCGGIKLRPESLNGDVERSAWLKFCQKLRYFQKKTE